MDTPFAPYPFPLGGTVIGHQVEPPAYLVARNGQVEGYPANGEPSEENVAADLANPPAPVAPVVVLKPLTILGRLTPAEEAALSGSTDLAVSIVRNRLVAASEIRSDDPRTAEGAAILVSKGIITEARAAEIFPL